MRFVTVTSDNKVYNGLLGIQQAMFLDLEKGLVSESWVHSGKLFLDNEDTLYFKWEPIKDYNDDYDYIYRIENTFGLVDSAVELFNSVQDNINIGKRRFILIYKNREFYDGIHGWKEFINLTIDAL